MTPGYMLKLLWHPQSILSMCCRCFPSVCRFVRETDNFIYFFFGIQCLPQHCHRPVLVFVLDDKQRKKSIIGFFLLPFYCYRYTNTLLYIGVLDKKQIISLHKLLHKILYRISSQIFSQFPIDYFFLICSKRLTHHERCSNV